MLVHVMFFVGRSQYFRLVDVVHADLLQYLSLGEVADAALGHHRYRNGRHNLANQLGIGHARDAALGPDNGGHPLQRHDRGGPGFLGDFGLFDAHDVHDDAALEHFGQAGLQPQAGVATIVL